MRDETLDDYLERNNLFLCRELTDEEIISCAEMDFVREELTNKTPEYMWIMDFARAILRKAQEK